MKTAVVTGGTRGIGRAVTEMLLKNGWSVFALYKENEKAAKKLTDDYNGQPLAVCRCDISDPNEISRVFTDIGSVSLLVNNAAQSCIELLTKLSNEQIINMISTDLTGAILCSREVLPSMINRKSGNIINISSMWGETGASCEAVYSAAKAGIIGFTKALAKEVAPSGIRVNCISPGVIQTEMNASLSEEIIEQLKEDTPLQAIGTAEDVANAVEFLISHKASFITGEILRVNGGYLI